jgi:hypothetical protein
MIDIIPVNFRRVPLMLFKELTEVVLAGKTHPV